MKTRILRTLLAAVAALTAVAVVAQPNFYDRLKAGARAGDVVSAINLRAGLVCKYIGTNPLGGTVTVAAGGDITFSVGAVGASAVSTLLECPVSGALGGIFDLSTPAAACDTVGEILDLINTSTSDFACVAPGMLRSDATDNVFFTLSETAANGAAGLAIPIDETVALNSTYVVAPREVYPAFGTYDIRTYRPPQQSAGQFVANPWQGYRTDFWKAISQTTYGSGTSATAILCVLPDLRAKSEVVTTIWNQAAAATATDQTIDFTNVGGLSCPANQKMIFRTTNSAALTALSGSVTGVTYDVK